MDSTTVAPRSITLTQQVSREESERKGVFVAEHLRHQDLPRARMCPHPSGFLVGTGERHTRCPERHWRPARIMPKGTIYMQK